MKETKRKLFKFYRSYYDIFNELDKDKDKLLFITSVLDKQFLGVDPKLKGLVKFAYVSQVHSIEKQVKGWQDATGEALTGDYTHPNTHPNIHPIEGGGMEVKVKEKEEVKEKEKEQQQVKGQVFNVDDKSFKMELQNSIAWLESVAMKLKAYSVSVDWLKEAAIPEFILHLQTQGEERKHISKAKSHFINWISKRLETLKVK